MSSVKRQDQYLFHLLNNNRSRLLKVWFAQISSTYPSETAKFISVQKDRFANPVGATISKEIEYIFDELLQEDYSLEIYQHLEEILRIRAVQDFVPSQAVGIFKGLKQVVRNELQPEINKLELQEQHRTFEDKIDQLCLMAFDTYMKCREKIWELKAKESQHRTKNLLQRKANVEWKTSTEEPES